MAVPAYTKTWKQLLTTGTPGARISYVSLIDTMQNFAYKLKDFLINSSGASTKWTLKWSASAGTGPTNSGDTTDRITSASTFSPRATTSAASQGWYLLESTQLRASWASTHAYNVGDIVVNSGNLYYCTVAGTSADSGGPLVSSGSTTDGGVTWQWVMAGTGKCQLLVCYQGSSDDRCRISFSPSAAFALAGTTNNQPTATDEQVLVSGISVIGATASSDRILHLWAADDGTGFRFCFFRAGAIDSDSEVVGLEVLQDAVVYPCVIPVPMVGFAFSGSQSAGALCGAFSANTRGAIGRVYVSGVVYSCQIQIDTRSMGNTLNTPLAGLCTTQGGGYQPFPLFYSTTNNGASCQGPLGAPYDLYQCGPTGFAAGDGLNSYAWVQINNLLCPNPSGVAPTIN